VAIQGVGNVGYNLCRYLDGAGARLVVADIDTQRVESACEEFAATAVPLDEILLQDVDVIAPCALGAVLNARSIPKIRSPIVAGGANNQLESREDGRRLSDAGILYAPDYVITGGGIINVACEYHGQGDDETVMQRVAAIGPRLTRIFEEAAETGRPTNEIADEIARKIIDAAS
jgi:leucine dehydrogenase